MQEDVVNGLPSASICLWQHTEIPWAPRSAFNKLSISHKLECREKRFVTIFPAVAGAWCFFSCLSVGIMFLLTCTSSSSLPYLILSVCHLMLRTYFTATTDQSDKKWWSVWLPILSWLCEQKRDLLALIMAIVGFGDVKARQKQAGRDVCIVASFSQKCLEPFIHNPQRELYMNEHPVQHKTTKRHVYIHC